ncbi:MAG: MBL fold metallo-hydrolase [Acidobacteria bacterium]|nr:MBL fold metallo-hydrolase [Acidobacteriota bacterium]
MFRTGVFFSLALFVFGPLWAQTVTPVSGSEAGFLANAYVVTSESGVVVIDTLFIQSDINRLISAVEATAKPLKAIVITHPHPDHYNGIYGLLQKFPGTPVYASQATIDGIHETAEPKRAFWKPQYGAEYPEQTAFPDQVWANGESIRLADIEFRLENLGPGEASDTNVLYLPQSQALFVGDLVYNQLHPWLAEGRSREWLQSLQHLQSQFPQVKTLYPGHGLPGGKELLEAQMGYIRDFQAKVKALGQNELSESETEALVRVMQSEYPHFGLAMLLAWNIQAVHAEK